VEGAQNLMPDSIVVETQSSESKKNSDNNVISSFTDNCTTNRTAGK
jgi:hypothetical protein